VSVDLLTFDDALSDAAEVADEPHLLLGNGFSISCRPGAFNYGALLDEATFDTAHGDIRAVFELLGTTDFEYTAVRTFLHRFRKIYSLNYDMLVYWAAMQDLEPAVPTNDGFTSGDDPDADYVVWEPYLDFGEQRLFFLHGGLHLYDTGHEISKITWSRTGVPLVDQIRDALVVGRYPLIVTEGNSQEKEAKILHNAYLNHAIRSFARIQKTLFIHGHSLAANDQHIFRRIEEGKLDRLYISVYGDPNSESNREVIARGHQMSANRAGLSRHALAVKFYDAKSAHVWG